MSKIKCPICNNDISAITDNGLIIPCCHKITEDQKDKLIKILREGLN